MRGVFRTNELLRFTSGSSIGVSFILPAKKEFVFYDNKLEVYNKGKLIKTVNYADIIEVVIMKAWQNNVFINVKPMGFNIYKVSDMLAGIPNAPSLYNPIQNKNLAIERQRQVINKMIKYGNLDKGEAEKIIK